MLEIVVAMGISALLFWLLLAAVNQFSNTARRASGGASAFDEARAAVGEIRRTLEAATLNPYWAVSYDADGYPGGYHRQSDLHFLGLPAADLFPAGSAVSGDALFFQAPLGYEAANPEPGAVLNALGYFVEWRDTRRDNPVSPSPAPAPRWRFQLREIRQAAEALAVMLPGAGGNQWVRDAIAGEASVPVAENIAWMRLRFRWPLSGSEAMGYRWESRLWDGDGTAPQPAQSHQVPPVVDIALLALDESTAARLEDHGSTPPSLPLQNLFADPAALDADLRTLEERLAAQWPGSAFRILRATVGIRSAKWSLDPTAPDPPEETPE